MVAGGSAASHAPWSSSLVQPKIDQTAHIHSFSSIIGDVTIGANVLVAPGVSIRAEEGGAFHVGEGTNLQDGVVIHGLEQGRVLGDDQRPYSVWIGKNTSITHMALVHGPAYVGNDCFIGFRSTVFNARIGDGCIVMMHALIQDVEILAGKFVPSGSSITSQAQADRLPNVQDVDVQFAAHLVGANQALRSGHHQDIARIAPIRQHLEKVYSADSADSIKVDSVEKTSSSISNSPMITTARLDSAVVTQVRQLLAQGYQIGSEHADKRHFQTSSWYSCTPIQTHREADVFAALENCVAEHPGEYVRIFGIDTKSKRRVSEMMVQRPGGVTVSAPKSSTNPAAGSGFSSYGAPAQNTSLSAEAIAKIRQFVDQGYQIGTEHADKRRFQTSSWTSCSPIHATRESDAIAALESCLTEHAGEYVRFFGIDTKFKQRVSEMIIQRPADKTVTTAPSASNQPSSSYSHGGSYGSGSSGSNGGGYSQTSAASGKLSAEVVSQVRQLLSQGHRVSAEHADKRRFQTSSWTTCAPIQSSRDTDVLSALETCARENPGAYVRLVGVDTKTKRRVLELIIQRP